MAENLRILYNPVITHFLWKLFSEKCVRYNPLLLPSLKPLNGPILLASTEPYKDWLKDLKCKYLKSVEEKLRKLVANAHNKASKSDYKIQRGEMTYQDAKVKHQALFETRMSTNIEQVTVAPMAALNAEPVVPILQAKHVHKRTHNQYNWIQAY